MVILKGEEESKLLRKAVQLNTWNSDIGKYNPTDLGRRIGLKPVSGMRSTHWLDESQCRYILSVIERNE